MIKELDTIVLSRDVEEYGLKQGDIGTAVHVYKDNAAYEVEFITGKGETVAIITLTSKDIHPIPSSSKPSKTPQTTDCRPPPPALSDTHHHSVKL